MDRMGRSNQHYALTDGAQTRSMTQVICVLFRVFDFCEYHSDKFPATQSINCV